jgi:PAS domain S-box-containing protein
MRITTQFITTMVLFGVILSIISTSVVLTNRRVDRLYEQEEIAHGAERDASDLSYLSNDYLLYREPQQRARWESKFASFSNGLSRLNPSSLEERALVADIRTNRQRLRAVFAGVVSALRRSPLPRDGVGDMTFIQVSSSRMAVQNQTIIFDALRLSKAARDQANQVRRKNIALIFALLGVFGGYFLAEYLLIYRRTLRSIQDLQAGTEVIGAGNLDFAVTVGREDEIGQLSRAFNRMTASLKGVTASKTELEREVTDRKQAEDALETALRRFYFVLSSMYSAMLLVADDGRVEFANQAFCDQYGLEDTPEDLAGLDSGEMIEKIKGSYLRPDEALRRIQEILDMGQPVKGEELAMRDGRTCLRDFVPLKLNGESYGRLWIHHDITSRKHTEETLRESEERYHLLFSGMTEGFALHEIICDDTGEACDYRFLDINPAFERLTGLKREDVVGKTVYEVIPGNDPYWVDIYGKVALTGESVHFENYSSGLDRHYEVFAYCPLPRQFAVIFTDITERKKAEEQIASAIHSQQLLLDHFPGVALLLRTTTREVVATNQAGIKVALSAGQNATRHGGKVQTRARGAWLRIYGRQGRNSIPSSMRAKASLKPTGCLSRTISTCTTRWTSPSINGPKRSCRRRIN